MPRSRLKILIGLVLVLFLFLILNQGQSSDGVLTDSPYDPFSEWWVLPLILFLFSILVGGVAALAGVGGAVLFVPVVSSFFPIHIDFVRGTGLMIALAGALYASPNLLRAGLADIRLALPMALISSTSAIAGAMIGLRLPANVVQLCLSVVIFFIIVLMVKAETTDFPVVRKADALSTFLRISGYYKDHNSSKSLPWQIHRTPLGLVFFLFIGFIAGMFGLGAGFANVPVLNLTLGVPLKLAVGTSKFILSVTDTTASWIYINSGGVVPIIAAPSVIGMIIGTRIGVGLLPRVKSRNIKWVVIVLLSLSSLMAFLKGIGF